MYSSLAFRDRIGRCLLRGLFNDSITIYHKVTDDLWEIKQVSGVQWSDRTEKKNENGKISVAKYATITFPYGKYNNLILDAANEEDAIVFGLVSFQVSNVKGSRISDLLELFPRSGRIKAVNRNENREFLKNVKVTVG